MIPGIPAAPAGSMKRGNPRLSENAADKMGKAASAELRRLSRVLLPHPANDLFVLYQAIGRDVLLVAGMHSIQKVLFPNWGLARFEAILLAVLITLFGFSEGVYRADHDPFDIDVISGIARSALLGTALVFLAKGATRNVAAAIATCASTSFGLLGFRCLQKLYWMHRERDKEARRVLIVGGGPVARSIATALRGDPLRRCVFRGFVDDDLVLSPEVLGRIADLDWLARAEFVDEVILAMPGKQAQTREAADVALRNHLDLRAVLDVPPGTWPDGSFDSIGGVPVVILHRESVPNAALCVKRLFDIASAGFFLVLLAPIMAIVALLIRLDSPGPIVYSAERTGAKGRRFRCYKFRSMVTNADHLKHDLQARNEREGPIFKIVDDPRITRVGRFIRRYSLDELPQLWNVLLGDMSMVGPRPHPVDEVNHYELPHYRRLDVKPGITGLWQITARHSPSFDLNMHLDLTYIENWNLRLDLRILLNTVRVLFAPEGS